MADLMPQAFYISLPSVGAEMNEEVQFTLVRYSNIECKKLKIKKQMKIRDKITMEFEKSKHLYKNTYKHIHTRIQLYIFSFLAFTILKTVWVQFKLKKSFPKVQLVCQTSVIWKGKLSSKVELVVCMYWVRMA